METTVILPCWVIDETLFNFTKRCISSLRDTSDCHIMVIDNGSTHGLDFMREEADTYVRNQTNLGYVQAINQGMKLSKTPYIVCGNNDYMMTEGWEIELQDCLNNMPNCGIVCPHVEGSPKHETPWEETGTPGGWYMIRAETINKIGLLDERWKNVFADYDFVWRMKKTGLHVYSTPYVTVTHYGEASMGKCKERLQEWEDGKNMLVKKWQDDPFVGEMLSDLGVSNE